MNLVRTILFFFAALLTATTAYAQIAFRAASQAGVAIANPQYVGQGAAASTSSAACPSIAPSVPAGSVGDLLIAVVSSGDNVGISSDDDNIDINDNVYNDDDLAARSRKNWPGKQFA